MKNRELSFILATSIFFGVCSQATSAQSLEWESFRPSNTGIPGANHLVVEYDPQGRLWYGAVWPVFVRGGVTYLDENGRWQTFASWETPLPSPLITDIDFQDSPSGVITWIGTEEGIARYDGIGWHAFDESNTPLATAAVTDLSVAPNGDVWVSLIACCGSLDGGIGHFDAQSFQWTYITGDDLPWPDPFLDHVASIMVDSKGTVWAVSASEDEIAQFDGTSWTLLPPGHTGRLFEGPNGDIWTIGLNSINRFDGTTWEGFLSSAIPVPIGSFDLTGAFVDSTNRLWLGTAQGDVVSWDGKTWSDHAHLGGVYVTEFAESPDGEIIVLTPFNSYVVTPNGLQGFYNAYNTGLTYHFIDGITATPNGDVWFIGASGFGQPPTGLSRLYDDGRYDVFNNSNNGFQPWPFGTTPGNPPVNDIAHDAEGNIYIATHSGGARWDGNAWETFTFENSDIWDEHCEYVAVDTRGWMWFGHYQTGVSRFDGKDWQVYQIFNSPMTSNQMHCVEADRFGNVWIGTSGNLVKFDGTNFSAAYDPSNSGLPSGWTNDVKVAPNGDVWVATAEGVARFDGKSWDTFTESNSGIPAGFCTSLAIRANGEVWVGGFNTATSVNYGGVASFDGTTWTQYLYGSSPISHQQVGSLEIDAEGNLWIGNESGEGVNLVRFITCPADIVSNATFQPPPDGQVDGADLGYLLAQWGINPGSIADLVTNSTFQPPPDGIVDGADLGVLLSNWGMCD